MWPMGLLLWYTCTPFESHVQLNIYISLLNAKHYWLHINVFLEIQIISFIMHCFKIESNENTYIYAGQTKHFTTSFLDNNLKFTSKKGHEEIKFIDFRFGFVVRCAFRICPYMYFQLRKVQDTQREQKTGINLKKN